MSHNLEKRWEAADEPKADDLLTGDEVLASQGIRSLCGSRRRSRHTIKIYAILIVMAAIAVSLFFGTAKASDIVTFKSTSTTADGTPLILAGKLTKPQAAGPFPAIVLLHECAGIAPYKMSGQRDFQVGVCGISGRQFWTSQPVLQHVCRAVALHTDWP